MSAYVMLVNSQNAYSRISHPSVSLHQDCWAKVLILVPPVLGRQLVDFRKSG